MVGGGELPDGKSFRRAAGQFAVACAFGLVGAFAALAAQPFFQPFPSMPPLMGGAPGDYSDALQRSFPPGSPEANLVHELWAEGFRPLTSLTAPSRRAAFVRYGDVIHDVCSSDERVEWSADARERLTSVTGHSGHTCP